MPEVRIMKASERELEAARFANDLFERMKEQDLAGELDFQTGLTIYWSLSGYEFEIGQECIEVSKKVGRFFLPITHWHPDDEEIFEEIRNIGTKGNVTVIHDGWLVKSVLYIGPRKDCPYKRKWLFGKYHYIYAE